MALIEIKVGSTVLEMDKGSHIYFETLGKEPMCIPWDSLHVPSFWENMILIVKWFVGLAESLLNLRAISASGQVSEDVSEQISEQLRGAGAMLERDLDRESIS